MTMGVPSAGRPRHPRILQLVAATSAAAVLATACAAEGASRPMSDGGADGAAATVLVGAASFAPIDLEVEQGTAVAWVWGGGVPHDVSGEGFSSRVQSDGEFQHVFDEPGVHRYRCTLHAGMAGTITVVAP